MRYAAECLRASSSLLASAESFTGGALARSFTVIPGISRVYWGGYIVYDNQAKEKMLNISPALIERHDAVSPEVVTAMLKSLFLQTPAHFVLATSGYAGPEAPRKELRGTVFLGVGVRESEEYDVRGFRLSGSRESVCSRSVNLILNILLEKINRSNGEQ